MPLNAFDRDGYQIVEAVMAEDECDVLLATLSSLPPAAAGTRDLLESDACLDAADRIRSSERLRHILPLDYVAVQCSLFSKTPSRNWLVAPHQDLSIPVRDRIDSPVCTGWSSKQGRMFTQPPVSVLERLIAVRLQLDPGSEATGPLQVLPGSHRQGRRESRPNLRNGNALHSCVVGKGGVVAMRPLLVHASSKAISALPRRVLHFLFGPRRLPHGLEWALAI